MATPNYVKFQRGTVTAYNKLKNNNKLDSNTLYFIYESSSSETGSLYMGDLLIASGVNNSIPEALQNLNTILTDEASVAFIMRDSSGEWKKATPAQVLEALDISTGTDSLTIDENQFVKVSGNLKLKGFDDAAAGSVLTKVNGQVSWSVPTDYSSSISSLQSSVGTLETAINGLDTTIATAISNANHLSYQVVTDLPTSDIKTNVIYLKSNGSTSGSDIYDEYMYIDGAFEKIGVKTDSVNLENYFTKTEVGTLLDAKASASDLTSLSTRVGSLETSISGLASKTDLNSYVLTSTFNSVVGSLSDFTSYKENETNTIIDALNVLDQRLVWGELTEN